MLYFEGGLPYEKHGDGITLALEVFHRKDGVKVLNMPTLLMIDYDLPSERHFFKASQVGKSLEHLRRVLASADALWEAHGLPPGPASWRIHRTAGGYHAFRMDVPVPPSDGAVALLKALVCDPGYISLVKNTRYWPIRVSRKTADEAEVYRLVEEWGAQCDECRAQIKGYDALVRRYANSI